MARTLLGAAGSLSTLFHIADENGIRIKRPAREWIFFVLLHHLHRRAVIDGRQRRDRATIFRLLKRFAYLLPQ